MKGPGANFARSFSILGRFYFVTVRVNVVECEAPDGPVPVRVMGYVPGVVPVEPDDPPLPPLQDPRPNARTSRAAASRARCGNGFLCSRAAERSSNASAALTNNPNGKSGGL